MDRKKVMDATAWAFLALLSTGVLVALLGTAAIPVLAAVVTFSYILGTV